MKINKADKIEEHFREIKTESIFTALKEKKYTGFTRSEINLLLEKYSTEQVFNNLKTRYRKRNYLLIYSIFLFSFLFILSGITLFSYMSEGELIYFKYLDFNYYSNLQLVDYSFLSLSLFIILAIALCMYEIILRIKNFRHKYKK
ncbi:hypothetical protein N9817_01885 [Candidatus Pelagibacter sp.]|jgi:hypothetical protein|nr:hypothetical protein [Candidatus Pelagibacter sp.]|tara:strand:+ start:1229 stop:1663 length:435 start_codon:yes stop_codon:yes gene_type:complete